MPYIRPERRDNLDLAISLLSNNIENEGDLNYAITGLCLSQRPASYRQFNTIIGVLECAKLEMYRRAVAPYEDHKRTENGDVY